MKIRFVHLASLLTFCILLVGCGPAPQKMYIPSASTSGSWGPRIENCPSFVKHVITADSRSRVCAAAVTKTIFRNQPIHHSIEDFYTRIKRQDNYLSLVSNCDLDILKAFIAAGWAPVVLLKLEGRLQFWALVGYDDGDAQIQLSNIARAPSGTSDLKRLRLRRLPYSDFVRAWSTRWPTSKCMLGAPGLAFTEAKVRSVLAKYLTATQASQVKVKSR